jgi:hypothetical protein
MRFIVSFEGNMLSLVNSHNAGFVMFFKMFVVVVTDQPMPAGHDYYLILIFLRHHHPTFFYFDPCDAHA